MEYRENIPFQRDCTLKRLAERFAVNKTELPASYLLVAIVVFEMIRYTEVRDAHERSY